MQDPRGPIRKIEKVEEDPKGGATLLTLSPCGHVCRMNQIFHYKVGNDCRCFQCRESEEKNHASQD
jgi:hypothetical protein